MTRPRRVALLLAAAAIVAAFSLLGQLRGALTRVVGDEGTYLAMIASLALDGDLEFGEEDLARVQAAEEPGRQALILQRAGGAVTYSKPIVFAALAAPAYLLLGERGIVLFNALAVLFAAWLARAFLQRLGPVDRAGWTLLTFLGAGAVLPYVVYRMSDLLQAMLALAGGVLAIAGARRFEGADENGAAQKILSSRWAPFAAGAVLGLCGVARYPNFLLPAGIVFALTVAGHWRRAAAVLAGTIALAGTVSLTAAAMTGVVTSYKADRATFNRSTGYPLEVEDEVATTGFSVRRATQSIGVKPIVQPATSAYATAYFAIGRHTGVLIYFPALLALLAAAVRRPDRLGLALLATAFGGVVFYVVWMPANYFGGATFVGNRYFLTLYPLFLLALPRLPGKRALASSWLLALVVFGSALLSVVRTREAAPHSQSHAFAGLFRALPFESTARNIDGRRDRYWSGDFLRFQDPFARVEEYGWLLKTGLPGSDVEIVSRHPQGELDFLVRSPTEDVVLEVSDWGSSQRFEVAAAGDGRGERITVDTSRPLRRHPFWWVWYEMYEARLLRFAVEAETQTNVEIRYLGTTLHGMFDVKVHSAEIPQELAAGAEAAATMRIRNLSHYPWYREGVVPVTVLRSLVPLDPGGELVEPERHPLPSTVVSGDPVDLEIPLRAPGTEGRYRLVIDLVYGDTTTFAQHVGSPLVDLELTVGPPAVD